MSIKTTTFLDYCLEKKHAEVLSLFFELKKDKKTFFLRDFTEAQTCLLLEKAPISEQSILWSYLGANKQAMVLKQFSELGLTKLFLGLNSNQKRTLKKNVHASLWKKLANSTLESHFYHIDDTFTLKANLNILTAISQLKKTTKTINKYVYLLDEESRLIGVCTITDIFNANSSAQLSEVFSKKVFSLSSSNLNTQLIIRGFRQYPIIPIVNREGIFMGILKQEKFFAKKTETVPLLFFTIEKSARYFFHVLDFLQMTLATVFHNNSGKK